jgi:uncharacterized phage protein (TIGR02216 family)
MQLGLGFLRLPPGAFWQMTLKELQAALTLADAFAPQPIERSELDRLMQQFPDKP